MLHYCATREVSTCVTLQPMYHIIISACLERLGIQVNDFCTPNIKSTQI